MHNSNISQAGKHFTNMYNDIVRQFDPNGELALLTIFSDNSPDDAISKIKIRDFNVIFGFFGARNARKVLCKVSIQHSFTSPVVHCIINLMCSLIMKVSYHMIMLGSFHLTTTLTGGEFKMKNH